MSGIFISYRRSDTAAYAGRLYDHLSAHFGNEHVFIDIDAIELGEDFFKTIEERISSCNALVAVIGNRWLEGSDEGGPYSLHEPKDFVRLEVLAALKRKVRVIPVLVGDATMPMADELPKALVSLAQLQALEISDAGFRRDVAYLVAVLEKSLPAAGTSLWLGMKPRWKALSFLILAAAAAGGGTWIYQESRVAEKSTSKRAVDISGKWRAVARKEGQRPFSIHFAFRADGANLLGTVSYPTGEAMIMDGRIDGHSVSFITNHRPDTGSEPARISFQGTISDDAIDFLFQYEGGIARGIATRDEKR